MNVRRFCRGARASRTAAGVVAVALLAVGCVAPTPTTPSGGATIETSGGIRATNPFPTAVQGSTPASTPSSSPLEGSWGGHARGLTIRSDGTGSGWFQSLCGGPDGTSCIRNVKYEFTTRAPDDTPGGVVAELVVTRVDPPSAAAVLTSRQRVVLHRALDTLSVGGTAFCGKAARPAACGI